MFDPVYTALRHLTSPVVAITTSAEGLKNGLIVNSAQRASLVPSIPRLSMYISKINYSHDLIYRSGVFTMHLLRNDQWDLIWRLGFQSDGMVRICSATSSPYAKFRPGSSWQMAPSITSETRISRR